MENYINLYAFLTDEESITIHLRFENYLNFSAIDCLDTFFIPETIFRSTGAMRIPLIIQLINQNFICLCYLDKFYIRGYGQYQKHHMWHVAIINGYDEEREILYCQDYFGHEIKQFEMTFTEFNQTIDNYSYPFNASQGLNGIRIKKEDFFNSLQISLSKLSQEVNKFIFGASDSRTAYGIAIFDFLLENSFQKGQNDTSNILNRWYDNVNFIKTSSELWVERISILKSLTLCTDGLDELCLKMKTDSTLLFRKLQKLEMKGIFPLSEQNKCKELWLLIREDYRCFFNTVVGVCENMGSR